ncbi:MAG: hypothetical protein KJ685_08690, partial [Nanoarchaeota archaeon]|nr:hypothetical protein [Nanoarchaeota archaeon]
KQHDKKRNGRNITRSYRRTTSQTFLHEMLHTQYTSEVLTMKLANEPFLVGLCKIRPRTISLLFPS